MTAPMSNLPQPPKRLVVGGKLHWHTLAILCLMSIFCCLTYRPVYAQLTVAPPTFSVQRGFYSTPFTLTLASSTTGAHIRYTTDGADPTATNGTLYVNPLTIADTTILRAVAYLSPTLQSPSVTQSYLFLADIRQQPAAPQPGWPSFFTTDDGNGPYPADYEMDPEIVNHPNYQGGFDTAMQSLPSISVVTALPNLWDPATGIYYNPSKKGDAWERPASIEWIDPKGGSGFAENVGIRLHGGASRRPYRTPKKTFRVYFRSIYGSPKLDFPLFLEADAVHRFDHILLRGGSNRSWTWWDRDQRRETDYVNDEFARRAFLDMGNMAPHGTYAHLYLNGLYWGLYNITERIDEEYLATYQGGTELDYDLISVDENNGAQTVAEAGDLVAWNELLALIEQNPITDATYAQILQRLDVTSLADYIILTHYVANTDWPYHNWYAYRKRIGKDTRIKFIPWDNDSSFLHLQENITLNDSPGTPAHLFLRLINHPDFKQVVSDRLYRHTTGNGALTAQRCGERYSNLTALVDQAVIGESARWGDYSRDVYAWPGQLKSLPAYLYSRDLPPQDADPTNQVDDKVQKTWLQVRNERLASYCPLRTLVFVNQYIANGWYTTTVQPPTFSQAGGAVAVGFTLNVTNDANHNSGEIYYTTTGDDPRLLGGTVAPQAINGGDSFNLALNQVTTVRARVKNGAQWSPLQEATFYPPQDFSTLVINEIHYHPAAPLGENGDLQEFIELYNRGAVPLRLDGLSFSRGLRYQFPLSTTLAAGGYLVLANNAAKFQEIYGFAPFDLLISNLSNNGETIELVDALGATIDTVQFNDLAPWPTTADGTGPSLELINPQLDNNDASHWQASASSGGTPGARNSVFQVVEQLPQVAITNPADGVVILVGNVLNLAATASTSSGTISQVQLFANGTPLTGCLFTQPPYTCQWTPDTAGAYALTAHASNSLGASGESAIVHVEVKVPVNQLPVTQITSPLNDTSFIFGNAITIRATASDSDGSVTQVAFAVNNDEIEGCVDTSPPYECLWTPAAMGAYTLTTQVVDNQSAISISAPVRVIISTKANQPPVVTMTAPINGDNLTLGNTFTLQATASDSDGSVTQVAFLANGLAIPGCVDVASPFTCNWTPAAGVYTLTAVVRDNDQATTTSSPVKVTVQGQLRSYLPTIRR